jgi:heat shock protein HslJ
MRPFRRRGPRWRTCHGAPFLALVGACIVLVALPLAACSSTRPAWSSPGFIGYDWQVVTISHDGLARSIPARLGVVLQFSRDGQFGANDSVNFHGGTFHTTGDGFTVSDMRMTLIGYAGRDPTVLSSINAIGSFSDGALATVKLTGDRLVVGVGSYTLTCQRRGRQQSASAGTGG